MGGKESRARTIVPKIVSWGHFSHWGIKSPDVLSQGMRLKAGGGRTLVANEVVF